jgi:hypothetical protein
MILCTRCNNETWATQLVTEHGPVMLAGPRGTPPQPVSARACTACGHIELYGPQPVVDEAAVTTSSAVAEEPATVPAATA